MKAERSGEKRREAEREREDTHGGSVCACVFGHAGGDSARLWPPSRSSSIEMSLVGVISMSPTPGVSSSSMRWPLIGKPT